jgi:DNA-binding MarR family transcriptional regulator
MTQNQTDTRPESSVGQAIGGALGQAQSVLAGLLVEKVEQAGTDREAYLALQRLGVLGDAVAGDRFEADLADWLDLDQRSAAALAGRLAAAGLAAEDGPGDGRTMRVTDQGARLRAQIAGSISAVTAPVYESISAADVETTVRTLRRLTTGVRAVSSGDPADGIGARS